MKMHAYEMNPTSTALVLKTQCGRRMLTRNAPGDLWTECAIATPGLPLQEWRDWNRKRAHMSCQRCARAMPEAVAERQAPRTAPHGHAFRVTLDGSTWTASAIADNGGAVYVATIQTSSSGTTSHVVPLALAALVVLEQLDGAALAAFRKTAARFRTVEVPS